MTRISSSVSIPTRRVDNLTGKNEQMVFIDHSIGNPPIIRHTRAFTFVTIDYSLKNPSKKSHPLIFIFRVMHKRKVTTVTNQNSRVQERYQKYRRGRAIKISSSTFRRAFWNLSWVAFDTSPLFEIFPKVASAFPIEIRWFDQHDQIDCSLVKPSVKHLAGPCSVDNVLC